MPGTKSMILLVLILCVILFFRFSGLFSWILEKFKSTSSAVMGTYKTLIVDDDLLFATQVERALTNLHQITKAHSVEEARPLFKKLPFDIVLLDKYLPNDQNGITLIPEIK